MDPVTLLLLTVGAQIGTRLTMSLARWLLKLTRAELVRIVSAALSAQDLGDVSRLDLDR